jgi:signal transduction histidine kinase
MWPFVKQVLSRPRVENSMMLGALALATAFSIHDLGQQYQIHDLGPEFLWWRGATIHLQPYSSIIVYSAFAFALGRRVLIALDTVENMNLILANRVADASARLEVSEATRRKLEVASALEQERERIMLEMHDGIGSSLITALGVAERKQASPETIAVLRHSITDLKIVVDSLEPIEGDVVTLLANLRHRLEPELKQAGLSFEWAVNEASPLEWLDAVGALHVLRILQEAISNIIAHANTGIIGVSCGPAIRQDQYGVLIEISDKGCGFDPLAPSQGKGIANMRSRAQSLHGEFLCESAVGKGTRLSLWLPQALRPSQ